MRDDEDGAALFLVHVFKHLNEVLEAPQVNTGLGFVKDRQLGAADHHGGDLNTLQLTARQTGVDFAVDIILCAQAHFREIGARLRHRHRFPGCQGQQIVYRDALKTHRLLKGKTDAFFGAFGDRKVRDILAIQQDLP